MNLLSNTKLARAASCTASGLLVVILSLGSRAAVESARTNRIQSIAPVQGIPPAEPPRVIKVPSEFPSIRSAVRHAKDGDWIILSPGKYSENNIDLNSAVTISSEWKLTGDVEKIEETIIDAGGETLFNISNDGVEISGLHIINGDHTLNILSKVTILHNHFRGNKDAMSFEESSGGYAGYNVVENDRDDGLDVDIGSDPETPGHDLRVSYNTIINSHDDGMEIRLFAHPNQNVHYEFSHNIIVGSKNAGIQLISYDRFTGKEFQIHHNIIRGCKAGLGCMEGSNTVENLGGASKMDELVCFFNNTLVGNQVAATGGNHMIAVNNIVQENALGGFKNFGKNSVVMNNLFFKNGGDDLIGMDKEAIVKNNTFSTDPMLDKMTFAPAKSSACIDAGIKQYPNGTASLIRFTGGEIAGTAPDIGAMELNSSDHATPVAGQLIVDAGDDRVVTSPDSEFELVGALSGKFDEPVTVRWKRESGPETVQISNPDQIETTAVFHENGIYHFSLTASDAARTGSDDKIVRFVREGSGHPVSLQNGMMNKIEGEDFAFAYGQAWIAGGEEAEGKMKCVAMEKEPGRQSTFIEYSLGASNSTDFSAWLLIKNLHQDEAAVRATFNGSDSPVFPVKSVNKWSWLRVPMNIHMTGGQWPLLITTEKGSVCIDKILLSPDKGYVPK